MRTLAAKYNKEIDLHLCKGCGICVDICPKQVYDRDALGKPIMARNENCIYCKQCLFHCPDFASVVIDLKEGEADV